MSQKYSVPNNPEGNTWDYVIQYYPEAVSAEELRDLYYNGPGGVVVYAEDKVDTFADTVLAPLWTYYKESWVPEMGALAEIFAFIRGASEGRLKTRVRTAMLRAANEALAKRAQISQTGLDMIMNEAFFTVYYDVMEKVEIIYKNVGRTNKSWWTVFARKYIIFVGLLGGSVVAGTGVMGAIAYGAAKWMSALQRGEMSTAQEVLYKTIRGVAKTAEGIRNVLLLPGKAIKRVFGTSPFKNIHDFKLLTVSLKESFNNSGFNSWIRGWNNGLVVRAVGDYTIDVKQMGSVASAALATASVASAVLIGAAVGFGAAYLTFRALMAIPVIGQSKFMNKYRYAEPSYTNEMQMEDMREMLERSQNVASFVVNKIVPITDRMATVYAAIEEYGEVVRQSISDTYNELGLEGQAGLAKGKLFNSRQELVSIRNMVGSLQADSEDEREAINGAKDFLSEELDAKIQELDLVTAQYGIVSGASSGEIFPYIDEFRVLTILQPAIEILVGDATVASIEKLSDDEMSVILSKAAEMQSEEIEKYTLELAMEFIGDTTEMEIDVETIGNDVILRTMMAAEGLTNLINIGNYPLAEFDNYYDVLVNAEPELVGQIKEDISEALRNLAIFRAALTINQAVQGQSRTLNDAGQVKNPVYSDVASMIRENEETVGNTVVPGNTEYTQD